VPTLRFFAGLFEAFRVAWLRGEGAGRGDSQGLQATAFDKRVQKLEDGGMSRGAAQKQAMEEAQPKTVQHVAPVRVRNQPTTVAAPQKPAQPMEFSGKLGIGSNK